MRHWIRCGFTNRRPSPDIRCRTPGSSGKANAFRCVRLVHGGRFLLLAGEQGDAWVRAADEIARTNGIPLDAATVGVLGCDYVDVRAAWLKHREIGPHGAVLVRPDRYIAFRALDAADNPTAVLKAALGQVLATEPV